MSALQSRIITDETQDNIRKLLNDVEDTLSSVHKGFKNFLNNLPEDPVFRLRALFWCLNDNQKRDLLLRCALWFSGEGLIQFDEPRRNEEMSLLFEQAFYIYNSNIQNTVESKLFIKDMWTQLQHEIITHFTLQKFAECMVGDGTLPRENLL